MNRDIASFRENYTKGGLQLKEVNDNPLKQFDLWMGDAIKEGIKEPNAMCLSTVDDQGFPDGRIVLLKGYDEEGYIFFTNYKSVKGLQLEINPKCSLVFLWKEIERQVRIRGTVKKLSNEKSQAYFNTRPTASQIGAWASPQSKTISNRAYLEERFKEKKEEFSKIEKIPIPPNWGGYIVSPIEIEFWQGQRSRLHDRVKYLRCEDGWRKERLAP